MAHLMGLTRFSLSPLANFIKPVIDWASCHVPRFPPYSSTVNSKHVESREYFTAMVSSGDQLASLISGLFATRLVIVRSSSASRLHLADLITTGRILKVKSAIGEASELFWLSGQSWHVWCSFGTTSSPLEWRSISFGNQSGISWRGCTSFSATYLLLSPFGYLCIVRLTFSLSFCTHVLFRSNGGKFEGDEVSGGILRYWRLVKLTIPTLKKK